MATVVGTVPQGIRVYVLQGGEGCYATHTSEAKIMPKGTIIKGPVAKEVAARFSTIGKLAGLSV